MRRSTAMARTRCSRIGPGCWASPRCSMSTASSASAASGGLPPEVVCGIGALVDSVPRPRGHGRAGHPVVLSRALRAGHRLHRLRRARRSVRDRCQAGRAGPGRDEYYLYVGRFEPENTRPAGCAGIRAQFGQRRLVMVGDAPYAAKYIRQVRSTRDPRVVFTGAVYGEAYAELQSHCHAYVHASEVGGTHPALVEAMGRACAVLYLDTPENREVPNELDCAIALAGRTQRPDRRTGGGQRRAGAGPASQGGERSGRTLQLGGGRGSLRTPAGVPSSARVGLGEPPSALH